MPQIQKMKIKICLVGEGAVGKTSLMRRFVYDEFDDRYITTMGAKVSKKDIMVREQNGSRVKVKMTIWDIMGQKSFRDIMKEAFFHGAQGVLAVCDVTRRETLSELHDWVASVHKVTGEIPIHFLGNKVDLKDQITFPKSELAEVAAAYDSPYDYTGARTGENVQEAFDNLAKMMVG